MNVLIVHGCLASTASPHSFFVEQYADSQRTVILEVHKQFESIFIVAGWSESTLRAGMTIGTILRRELIWEGVPALKLVLPDYVKSLAGLAARDTAEEVLLVEGLVKSSFYPSSAHYSILAEANWVNRLKNIYSAIPGLKVPLACDRASRQPVAWGLPPFIVSHMQLSPHDIEHQKVLEKESQTDPFGLSRAPALRRAARTPHGEAGKRFRPLLPSYVRPFYG